MEFDSLPDQKPDEHQLAMKYRACYVKTRRRRTNTDLNEPKTVKEAQASPDKAKWMTAMDRDWNSFTQMMSGTWWKCPRTKRQLGASGYLSPR